jgi:hypothetical protein
MNFFIKIISNLLETISHEAIDVKLIVTLGTEEIFVFGKIIVENSAVINHATESVINDRSLYAMCRHTNHSSVDTIFCEFGIRSSD